MTSLSGNMGNPSTGSMMAGPTGKVGNKTPSGYRTAQTQQFTPEMMQLFSQLFSHVGPESQTSRLASGDQSAFEDIEAPALKQFSGLQGQLASRFSGMGSGGAKSSGFKNSQNMAASDFAQQLQSNRQDLRRQALNDLMGFSSSLLNQRPYETQLVEKGKPWWQELLSGVGGTAAKAGVESAWGG